jgi:hypothetical protein
MPTKKGDAPDKVPWDVATHGPPPDDSDAYDVYNSAEAAPQTQQPSASESAVQRDTSK